jgi:putative holliday junction resolvase
MRILAIDPGTARCGLATCDALGITTTPAGVVHVTPGIDLAGVLAAKAGELEAEAILLGHPLNMDGSAGPRARASERLAEELRGRTTVPVTLVDERLTSFEASERLAEAGRRPKDPRKRRDGHLDAAAAAVLLQRWLERQGTP